tara:strand:+ start:29 stop:232 length:204 start_codon:yes stop_codon:yes gene_type:complete
MEKKESWQQRNPGARKEIQKKWYSNNQEQAKLRSKRQNLRGKTAYSMLSDTDKRKCDKQVEKLLQSA